ncbi:MAG: hypothetical protein AAFN65_15945, partial [Bacteroidota bacterium]
KDLTQGVVLKVPIEAVTRDFVTKLDLLCKKHEGDQKLRVTFIDHEKSQKLQMIAHQRSVEADSDFINEIDKMGISYELQSSSA